MAGRTHPLHDAVEEAWFGLDAQLRIEATLTRSARELCTTDPVCQPLQAVLGPLLSGDELQSLLARITATLAEGAWSARQLPPLTLAMPRAAEGPQATRVYEPRLHPGGRHHALLLGLRDITEAQRQRGSLEHAQSTAALALAVVGADPVALQSYLRGANVSISMIKSLLQLPARDPAAFRHKLERILAEVLTLRGEAADLGLAAIADGARDFEHAVAAVAAARDPGGDDFLPLAARLNDLFARVTAATAMLERKARRPAPRPASLDWHLDCEARLHAQAARLAEQHGSRVDLVLMGLEVVPEQLRESVDGVLTQLLANAVEHGIEPVAARIAQGKRPAGTVTVQLAANETTLELSLQDDGRGFDTAKLGQAAVACGLLTEQALQRLEGHSLIGLIFKPGFSTAAVSSPGRGLGMEFLRELVARLDGRFAVATKARLYTRFRVELPLQARAQRRAG
jgi:signal transduction histidine kinase